MEKTYKAVIGGSLSTKYKPRYVIVNIESGEILDDAQGYGYKDIRGAYAAYGYNHRDKNKDKAKQQKEALIKKWCKENHYFIKMMDEVAFEIAKGSWGPDDKMNAKMVKELLKNSELENLPFTAGELLAYWKKH